ncbi:hypothetical protein [Pseudoalteromonas sp. H105]|uniref:hypothetical protein n=1 Tax=Pseudoalteromonas sp. H105 TaxID=1348393 RepID=UPI0007320FE5|nr:hypothetical protein [Pseudoalteromonas sp. H105]KTF18089.1 hypothetical protein ATS75_01355 [Pseudoalteromonas sp. H105]
MPLMRWLSVMLFSFLITACGGGGTIEKDGDKTSVYTLAVQGYSTSTGEKSNTVTSSNSLQILAQLKNNNNAVAGERITFSLSDGVGTLDPISGTAVTDSDGIARINITAGTIEGAGEVSATIIIDGGTYSDSFAFSASGDQDQVTEEAFTLTLQGYTETGTQLSNSVTNDAPLDIRATLKQGDTLITGQRITFSLIDSIGSLTPSSGTALTGSDGIAHILLTAGSVAGAGEITARFTFNGVTYSNTFAFTSAGDATGNGTISLALNIVDQSGAAFTDENPVSKDNKGIVTATLTQSGAPLVGELVRFVANFTGKITPELGTALTNENGQAKVTLSSGLLKGAGQVVASYTSKENVGITQTIGFISSGDDASVETAVANVDVKLLQGCNEGWDSNRNTVSLESTYLSSGCTEVNQFSSEELIDVLVKVTDTSSGDGFAGIISETTTDLGSLLPESGKALTDNFGLALLKLQPGANSGAGQITATSKSASNQKAFEIATADLTVTIDNGLYNQLDADGNIIEGEFIPLGAGATTVITVKIFDTSGNLVVSPLDVEFTSGCVQNNTSVMDTTTTSVSGVATATYRTDGCNAAQGDTVRANVLTGGTPVIATVNIPVSTAPIESIEFIDASEPVIALKGTGGQGRSETSEITFKLKDKIGKEVQSNRMDFRLSSTNGGISLSHSSVFTDAEGLARVQVNAGFVPMAVRVQACYIPEDQIPAEQTNNVTCWQDLYLECLKDEGERAPNTTCPTGDLSLVALDEQVTTVSDLVSISSGLPDGNSFTAGSAIINIEALDYIGDLNEISVYLADHFNNPVPDGTAVYLTTEGGAVGTLDGTAFNPQLECRTVDGACNAQWRGQNPKPFTDAKWGNQISSINPKTNNINCDLYFNTAAPCMAGILNAATFENGVPLGGRATVLVTAKGQESFIDINGNGRFDTNEYYSGYDLAEAFVDHNENGVYDGLAAIYNPITAEVEQDARFCQEGDANDPCSPENTNAGQFEENFDIDLNGMHTLADGKYNGLLCTEAATSPSPGDTFETLCTKDVVDVRESFEIIMSGSQVYSRFVVLKAELRNQFASRLAQIELDDEDNPILDGDGNTILTANAVQLGLDIDSCNSIYGVAGESATGLVVALEPTAQPDFCDLGTIDLTPSDNNELEALSFALYYSDRYNNPIPSGTAVAISTDNGKYSGSTGFAMLESAATAAHGIALSISREAEPNKSTSGFLSIVFTTPKEVETTAQLAIRDAG